ncbi:hypothetical protein ACFWW8_38410, partial [Streptomyces sp. NPDC058701]
GRYRLIGTWQDRTATGGSHLSFLDRRPSNRRRFAVRALARWLGHSSPTIIFDHYAHFMPEAGGKGRAAIDALLGTVPEHVPEGLVSSHGSI